VHRRDFIESPEFLKLISLKSVPGIVFNEMKFPMAFGAAYLNPQIDPFRGCSSEMRQLFRRWLSVLLLVS